PPRAVAFSSVRGATLLPPAPPAGRAALPPIARQDRLPQPYRLRLFPWMEAVAEAARGAGALGCVLSGAGPSMLAAARADAAAVARAMEGALAGAGVRGRALDLAVARAGATWAPA